MMVARMKVPRIVYGHGVGIVLGIINNDCFPVLEMITVLDAGHGHNDGLIIFPLQTFLDDFQVQQPRKRSEIPGQGAEESF